jgi:hypothetical protein
MSWIPFVGSPRGSEGGIVEIDEEHEQGARITLERNARNAPYAITCGIYGWMLHTRFFGDRETARRDYEAMKAGLAQILSLIPLESDPDLKRKTSSVIEAIGNFVERFPT